MQYEIIGGQNQDSTYNIAFQTESVVNAKQWISQFMEQYPDWECKITVKFLLSNIVKLVVCDGYVTCYNVELARDRLESILEIITVIKATGNGYGKCWDIQLVVE